MLEKYYLRHPFAQRATRPFKKYVCSERGRSAVKSLQGEESHRKCKPCLRILGSNKWTHTPRVWLLISLYKKRKGMSSYIIFESFFCLHSVHKLMRNLRDINWKKSALVHHFWLCLKLCVALWSLNCRLSNVLYCILIIINLYRSWSKH